MEAVSGTDAKSSRDPEASKVGCAMKVEGIWTDAGSGRSVGRPERSSMLTRHKCIGPLRSLMKYRCCPSRDQTGFQFDSPGAAASTATTTSPPSGVHVEMVPPAQ